MQKIVLTAVFIIAKLLAQAQTDTVYFYFDKDWQTAPKGEAFFYGKKFREGNGWRRQDFWVKGNVMQMDGFFVDTVTRIWEGVAKWYNEDGTLDDSAYFENQKQKSAYYFYPNHSIKAYILYDANGDGTEQKGFDEAGKEIPGFIVQQPANFPGGLEKWQKFLVNRLQKNLPKSYKKGDVWGVVNIQFLVLKDGSVSEVKVIKSSGHPELDDHAIAIITDSPVWIPAVQFNKPVIFRQRQLITYSKPD